ncbi:hypothetical protein PROFUN_11942 [Planoprotostelium fungivorum]|uniref:Guanylate cyclase domain-containing protein n=1 Tax=Planoprotostelium fungivorum TaxID=1890364 RepID=A0A2P6N8W2_9EUKA|nr:hypothetical protein PROFUN_11942 [Planoprotostelium fungivorum]
MLSSRASVSIVPPSLDPLANSGKLPTINRLGTSGDFLSARDKQQDFPSPHGNNGGLTQRRRVIQPMSTALLPPNQTEMIPQLKMNTETVPYHVFMAAVKERETAEATADRFRSKCKELEEKLFDLSSTSSSEIRKLETTIFDIQTRARSNFSIENKDMSLRTAQAEMKSNGLEADIVLERKHVALLEQDVQELTQTVEQLRTQLEASRNELSLAREEAMAKSSKKILLDMSADQHQLKQKMEDLTADLHLLKRLTHEGRVEKDDATQMITEEHVSFVLDPLTHRIVAQTAPTGNITLVFSDVMSSTSLWEQNPSAMSQALAVHNDVIVSCVCGITVHIQQRRSIARHGGYEVKTEGDSFMVSFGDSLSAFRFCVQSQEDLQGAPGLKSFSTLQIQRQCRGLRVRMGIHSGTPICQVDPTTHRMDYFGRMVNKAARISGVACGGQIIASTTSVNQTIRDHMMETTTWMELGCHPLKGLSSPVEMMQVTPKSLGRRIFPVIGSHEQLNQMPKLIFSDVEKLIVTNQELQNQVSTLENKLSHLNQDSEEFEHKLEEIGDVLGSNESQAILQLYDQYALLLESKETISGSISDLKSKDLEAKIKQLEDRLASVMSVEEEKTSTVSQPKSKPDKKTKEKERENLKLQKRIAEKEKDKMFKSLKEAMERISGLERTQQLQMSRHQTTVHGLDIKIKHLELQNQKLRGREVEETSESKLAAELAKAKQDLEVLREFVMNNLDRKATEQTMRVEGKSIVNHSVSDSRIASFSMVYNAAAYFATCVSTCDSVAGGSRESESAEDREHHRKMPQIPQIKKRWLIITAISLIVAYSLSVMNLNRTLLIGIFTSAARWHKRALIRSTYASVSNPHTDVKFVIGLPSEADKPLIEVENRTHGDIFVLPIQENMNNGKTLQYFQSARENYGPTGKSEVRYDWIMKCDEDSWVALNNLTRWIRSLPKVKGFAGLQLEYEKHAYMQGRGYLMTMDLVEYISDDKWVEEHKREWPEDIQTGIWVTHHDETHPTNKTTWHSTRLFAQVGKWDYDGHEATHSRDTMLVHGLKTSDLWYSTIHNMRDFWHFKG